MFRGYVLAYVSPKLKFPALPEVEHAKNIQTHIRASVFYLYKYTLCHFHQAPRLYNKYFCCWRHINGFPPAENLALLPIPFGARFVISLLSIFRRLSRAKAFIYEMFRTPFPHMQRIFSLKGCSKSAQMMTCLVRNSKVINLIIFLEMLGNPNWWFKKIENNKNITNQKYLRYQTIIA